jgi:hypothetical protein
LPLQVVDRPLRFFDRGLTARNARHAGARAVDRLEQRIGRCTIRLSALPAGAGGCSLGGNDTFTVVVACCDPATALTL